MFANMRNRDCEVRRVHLYLVVVDARRVDSLGRRHLEPSAPASREPPGQGSTPPPSIRSATGASGTSGRSSWRSCSSALGGLFAIYEGWHKLGETRPWGVERRVGHRSLAAGHRARRLVLVPDRGQSSRARSRERRLGGSSFGTRRTPRASGRAAGRLRCAHGPRPRPRRCFDRGRSPETHVGTRMARSRLASCSSSSRHGAGVRDEEPVDRRVRARAHAQARSSKPSNRRRGSRPCSIYGRSTSGPTSCLIGAEVEVDAGA